MHEKNICACRALKEISPENAACGDYKIIDHICLECSNYKVPAELCTLEECKYQVSLDDQNSVCSKNNICWCSKHNIYWCRKEQCEEIE